MKELFTQYSPEAKSLMVILALAYGMIIVAMIKGMIKTKRNNGPFKRT